MKFFVFAMLALLQGRLTLAETENHTQEIRDMFQEYFGVINEEIQLIKEKYDAQQAKSELLLNKMVDMLVASKHQVQSQQELKEDVQSIKRDVKLMMETHDENNQSYETKLGKIVERLDGISLTRNETSVTIDIQDVCNSNTDLNLKEVDFRTVEGQAGGTSDYGVCCTPTGAFNGTEWHSGKPATMPQAVWFHFDQPIKVVIYSFKSRSDRNQNMKADGPSKYEFFGTNGTDCGDQSSWKVLKQDNSGTPFSSDYDFRTEYVKHPDFYTCYGFRVTEVPGRSNGDKWAVITNVRFLY